jgi:hypothetical protein
MWTPTTRKQHIRQTSRYQTDVTDEEWRVIEPRNFKDLAPVSHFEPSRGTIGVPDLCARGDVALI